MKFSFMTFSCPELDLESVLELAQRYGYDGIEPRVSAKHQHGIELDATPEQRREIVRKVDASGIQLSCIATSCCFADPANATEHAADARQYVELAADLGAPCIRVFGGRIGAGVSRDAAIGNMAALLRPLAEYAGKLNVSICMETHDDWCNPADVAAVMRAVDHPGMAVNWDIMHPVRTKLATIDQSFEQLRTWIRHAHVHDGVVNDGKLSLAPIGQGIVDHKRAVTLLHNAGYDGFLSGEWIGWSDAYPVHLPREIATLKQYLKEAAG
ncbi:MAG: sugar phosphate isomerase/epimerase family protein [Kiritimatiellia bacterium]|jgi:sugar phosphate isomerase/epimerase